MSGSRAWRNFHLIHLHMYSLTLKTLFKYWFFWFISSHVLSSTIVICALWSAKSPWSFNSIYCLREYIFDHHLLKMITIKEKKDNSDLCCSRLFHTWSSLCLFLVTCYTRQNFANRYLCFTADHHNVMATTSIKL